MMQMLLGCICSHPPCCAHAIINHMVNSGKAAQISAGQVQGSHVALRQQHVWQLKLRRTSGMFPAKRVVYGTPMFLAMLSTK